ncbi:hypothetical protein QAD02_011289 [Eretmocerus hayati]|uniref:Uncharacterized protein n=1 Tax=Eretmocerus hayati TaxID=131215 RepID=A0ACC2NWC1_9HYME|nr:hypothetical protein QAD02_011289 [Eretmocerus hayati]
MEFDENLECDKMIKEEDDSQSRDENQKLSSNMLLLKLKMSKVDSLIQQYSDKMKENDILTEQITSLKEEKKKVADKYNQAQEKVTRLELTLADDKKALQMLKKDNRSQGIKLDENDKRMGQLQSRISELELLKSTAEEKIKVLEKEVKSAKSKPAVKKPSVKHQGSQTIDLPKQDVPKVIKSPEVKHSSTNTTESLNKVQEPFPFYCSKCKHNIEPAPVEQILQTMSVCPPLIPENISPPVSPHFNNLDATQHFPTKIDNPPVRNQYNSAEFSHLNLERPFTHPLTQNQSSFMEFDRLNKKVEKLEKLIKKKHKQKNCCHQNCCSSKDINLTLNIPRQENSQNRTNFVKRKFVNVNVSPKKKLKSKSNIQKSQKKTDWNIEDSGKTIKRKSNIPDSQVASSKKRRLTSQQKIDLFKSTEIDPVNETNSSDGQTDILDRGQSSTPPEQDQPPVHPRTISIGPLKQKTLIRKSAPFKSLDVTSQQSNTRPKMQNNQTDTGKSASNQIPSEKKILQSCSEKQSIYCVKDRQSVTSRNGDLSVKSTTVDLEVHQGTLPSETLPVERKTSSEKRSINTAKGRQLVTSKDEDLSIKSPTLDIKVHPKAIPSKTLLVEEKASNVSRKEDMVRDSVSKEMVPSELAGLKQVTLTILPLVNNSIKSIHSQDDGYLTSKENPSGQDTRSSFKSLHKDTLPVPDENPSMSKEVLESEASQIEDASMEQNFRASSPISSKLNDSPSDNLAIAGKATSDELETADSILRKTPSRRGRKRISRVVSQRQTRAKSSTPKDSVKTDDEIDSVLSSSAPLVLETDISEKKPLNEEQSPTRMLRSRGSRILPVRSLPLRSTNPRKNMRSDEDCTLITELSPSVKKPRVYPSRRRGNSSTMTSPEVPPESKSVSEKNEVQTPNLPRESTPDKTMLDLDTNTDHNPLDTLLQIDLTSEKSFPNVESTLPHSASLQSGDGIGENHESFLSHTSNTSYEDVKNADLESESVEAINMYAQDTSTKIGDSPIGDSPESPPEIESIEESSNVSEKIEIADQNIEPSEQSSNDEKKNEIPTHGVASIEESSNVFETSQRLDMNGSQDEDKLEIQEQTNSNKKKKGPKKKANKNQRKNSRSQSLHEETTLVDEESPDPSQKSSMLIDETNSCLSKSGVVIELNNFISSQNDPSQKKKRRLNQKVLKKIENNLHEEIFSITEAEEWTSEINQKVVQKFVSSQDIKFPAHCIVEHIAEKLTEDEDIDKSHTPPAPLMTRTEQQIVTLIVEIDKVRPDFIDLVSVGIQFKLFRLNAAPQKETVVERLSRVFVVLSKIKKDREKVRMFICDAFYCLKMRAVNVLYVALQSWPEVLPKYDSNRKDIVLKTIIHSVMTMTSKLPYNRLISLRKLMSAWYGYPNVEYNKETFKQEILESLQENAPGANTAVLLFCKKNNPSWSLENIIWPLKQMIVSQIHPDPYEAFCLLGNLLRSFPPKEYDTSIIEIIDQLCEILDAQVSADLQEGIVACLLSLTKYKFDRIARSVIKWECKELRPVTKEKLKSLFRCHNAAWWSKFVSKNFPCKQETSEKLSL